MLLINTILEVINKNEAVLIYFGYHESIDRVRYILRKLQRKFGIPDIFEITGKISQAERKKVEDAIKPRDVVLITSAGTESVNLQKANNLIFYEVPFPIREFVQASGRITRMNSKFSKFNIYVLEADQTIDTYKKMRLQANMALIKAVLGGKNTLPVEMLILSQEDKEAMKDKFLWKKK
jgi:superfamily II DNA/RNA helicase